MFLAWAVAAACLLAAPASAWTSGKVGGACAYESYPGFAEIVSVKELPADEAAHRRFDVRFVFHPEREVTQSFAAPADRQFLFLLDLTRQPDEKDVQAYGLKPGARVKGVMQVIVKGTCTPVLFDFTAPEGKTCATRSN